MEEPGDLGSGSESLADTEWWVTSFDVFLLTDWNGSTFICCMIVIVMFLLTISHEC